MAQRRSRTSVRRKSPDTLWAYENAPRHTLDETLLARLKEQTDNQSLPDEEREKLRDYFRILSAEDPGQITIYEPRLGNFFNYGSGDTLWQAAQYEQTPMGDEARASLERDIRDFGVEVDLIVAAGEKPSSPVRMLSQTPLVMQLVGRDTLSGKVAARGGIYAAPHVFDGTHPNITPKMLKQVPAAMADPIAVFDSATHPSSGDLVFMLELVDENGATVVVPVTLQSKGDRETVEINIAKTIYAKTDFNDENKPYNNWFREQFKNKKARYVNGQKIQRWQANAGVQFPFALRTNALEEKIYTETDLVNARSQNQTLYQTAKPTKASEFSDARYFEAVENGDMETAQRIVDYLAAKKGYASMDDYRLNHRAPNSHDEDVTVNLANLKDSDLVPDDYWEHPEWYTSSPEERESFFAVKRAMESRASNPHIMMYRAVPKSVREDNFRNGDWITPSREYAQQEGRRIPEGFRIIAKQVPVRDVWWDGNSVAEFGYDDGKNYLYKNTKNNRKLADAVVRDYDGNIVPPSKRFNQRAVEVFYQTAFHGTPHRFDRFSLDNIGSGEGAQAHDWGLYFAQDKEVSENYRAHLAREGADGQVFHVDIPENNVLLDEQRSIQEREDDGEKLDVLRDALHEIAWPVVELPVGRSSCQRIRS